MINFTLQHALHILKRMTVTHAETLTGSHEKKKISMSRSSFKGRVFFACDLKKNLSEAITFLPNDRSFWWHSRGRYFDLAATIPTLLMMSVVS